MASREFILRRTALALAGAALMLCSGLATARAEAAATLPTGFQDEVALQFVDPGIEQPTNFRFAADGRTFVALKGGKIVVFPAGATSSTKPQIFANLAKQVYDNGDHGLLGLALDPKFDAGRPYVYALYTFNHELGKPPSEEMPKWPSAGSGATAFEGDACPEENKCIVSGRLVRLTAEGDHAKPSAGAPEEKVLLEDWCQQSTTHSIGDLAFGPEGALFVSGGEGAIFTVPDYGQFENLCGDPNGTKGVSMVLNPDAEGGSVRSQSIFRPNGQFTLDGAILRIDPDTGEGWPGNPFATDLDADKRRVIGVGFRNPFRFTLNERLGALFVNNVGNGEDEEIDQIPIGQSTVYNSGWPCYEGLISNYQFEVLGLNACKRLYETPNSTEAPFFYYSHASPVAPGDICPTYNGSAIGGAAFYEGSSYPSEYDDALFFADVVRGCIYVIHADEDGDPDPSRVTPFLSEATNYPGVDIEQGPDGSLYYASLYANTINQIVYDPGAPTARLAASKTSGEVPLTVEFDASESFGPPGDTLKYEWDLDGDGEFDDGSNAPQQSEEYVDGSANVVVAVRVKDLETGKSSVARQTIYPGDTPPVATISKPSPTLTWSVGQQIQFAGSATEHDGSKVDKARLYWKTRLLHCPFGPENCHEHPIQVFPGVESGVVGAPDHDYPSYINFILTATDSRGLTSEVEVKVAARPVGLRFESQPAGINIVAGTKTLTTPSELLAIEDSPTTVAAPESVVIGGYTYSFERWSDGGARVHNVATNASGSFTAFYSGGPPASPVSGPPAPTSNPPPSPAPALTPPKIEKRPQKTTTSTTAKFVFKGSSGLRFRCRIDGKRFSSCRSPRTYKNLKPGKHSFRVFGVDASGVRVTNNTTFQWKVVSG